MRPVLLGLALLCATTGAAAPAAVDHGCAGTLLRAGDGAAVTAADRVRGESVRSVVGDGRGGWYIGGDFWQVGSVRRQNLAHLDGNGRVEPAFRAAVDGEVGALAVADGKLYLAGGFRSVDGVPRAGVAAVDASTGGVTPWQPAPGFQPDSIDVVGNTVYLGSIGSIAAVDTRSGTTSGSALPGGSPFTIFRSTAYVKGSTRYYGPLAAYDVASGQQIQQSADARGYFSQVVAGPRRILLSGRFATDGKRSILLAAWAAHSRELLWTARVAGSFVNAVAVSGNRVYLGGLFRILSGQPRPRLGAVDLRTGRAIAWIPNFNATRSWTPLTLATNGSRVYVGSAVTAPGQDLPACARRS